jgi:DNA processing protein
VTPAERAARLALARSDGVGPVGFGRLLARFGSGEAALRALPRLAGAQGRRVATLDDAAREFAAAEAAGAFHIFLGEAAYPPLLAELADPPPVLLARGNPGVAARPAVAMVGARNASAAARAWAREVSRELASAGFAVVSGLARGVDGAAHEGALEAGATVGCVAGGVDVAYPPEHADLQNRIAAGGLVVGEMPPGVQPQARHFPRRNRLIAGMAQATVVVEAALGSGSLITARIAGEAGREVMAVPGSPLDPRARGGNALLKEGATLVEDAGDILAVLRPFEVKATTPRPQREDRVAQPELGLDADAGSRVRALLGPVPVPVEELVRQTGLAAAVVGAVLTDLEVDGVLARHAGGRVALAA